LVTDTAHAVTQGGVGAVIHTTNDGDEAYSLVDSIQALMRAGERTIAEYLIRDLKSLVSDIVALYSTGAYVRGSASALHEALRKHLWELEPERVKEVIDLIEEHAESEELSDVSDATVFLNHVLELLGYDTSAKELRKMIMNGLTPEEAVHTALVALVVAAGGVAWNDEIEN